MIMDLEFYKFSCEFWFFYEVVKYIRKIFNYLDLNFNFLV